ncbi:proton-associated sugar transporter A isoform X11 [Drosophila biarmipes]|uniref:proton-associated sugar transporter A isoform X7 n=2 Tax=Drosophila biarmipes TaxID=125945 RepID=UPI0021CCB357|nr:proton-associated sugar transporter A isoform X7 [Drosophila biarmipes]XP_050745335.1 proton-associated sugar transporter A isoform X8 [Drosophila biarmipes]XP_050745336.1 proton-associated sugar transporter A isoform X9 [Drosophila biarmipes]XP_050745339.1 proton-associated sugar transporter A isoform X11 [Drosophila biarmipes]
MKLITRVHSLSIHTSSFTHTVHRPVHCTGNRFNVFMLTKTRTELIRVSAAVMGIEFSYAAETAFVSPTLLKIGVEHQHMTLVWALSPLVGFFLCPILGSLSDRCKLNMGRRRPFILLLSVGVILGLLLVPNGETLGNWFGDKNGESVDSLAEINHWKNTTYIQKTSPKSSHSWGILFTILGTVLLDFDADACQSPARAYLLDVCLPEDHAKGLSTFTVMAGLGGFFGYSMGGLNWDETEIGRRLGGHVKAVFSIITIIFVTCVAFTITSFAEIPLWVLATADSSNSDAERLPVLLKTYGACDSGDEQVKTGEEATSITLTDGLVDETPFIENPEFIQERSDIQKEDLVQTKNKLEVESLRHYLLSIIYMPLSLRMICMTNLFCWMAHVCYSLYFTDFVGEAVFKGDPRANTGSDLQLRYEEGVRFGCWGMAMYSLSCSFYSLIIEKLIQRFKAKSVYVGGLIFYCTGMALMALTRAKLSVLVFSWTAGIMYSTLFTMPYLLVAHYHNVSTFELDENGAPKLGSGLRGLGTDIAIISSMVFLAQFILSLCMGTIIKISGTTTAVISTASFLSFCGALSATKIMYLDL